MTNRIIQGDSLAILRTLPSNSVHSIVTDPPSGIGFMNLDWDHDKGGKWGWIRWLAAVMTEAHRVLKPGGHALVWALPRTSHWTADALEIAGFEIRDVVMHVFGSGFPKGNDISRDIDEVLGAEREKVRYAPRPDTCGSIMAGTDTRPFSEAAKARGYHEAAGKDPVTDEAQEWDGWKTHLKPAAEHWILCRKPLAEKSIARNVLAHRTGGINIGACRVGDEVLPAVNAGQAQVGTFERGEMVTPERVGRYPSHLLLDEQAAEEMGEQSRFFYCPKPSRSEKNAGLQDLPTRTLHRTNPGGLENDPRWAPVATKNSHPTVKPIALMRYLCRLITPPGGVVLDPFTGSGTTGIAALLEGFEFQGIEMDPEYCEIARRRIDAAIEEVLEAV